MSWWGRGGRRGGGESDGRAVVVVVGGGGLRYGDFRFASRKVNLFLGEICRKAFGGSYQGCARLMSRESNLTQL